MTLNSSHRMASPEEKALMLLLMLVLLSAGAAQLIIKPPKDVSGLVGGSAEFMSEVDTKNTPTMEWEFNQAIIYSRQYNKEDYPMGKSKYAAQKDGKIVTLTVKDLHFSDGGKYIFRVLSQVVEVHLLVISTPKFVNLSKTTEEGGTAQYICVVQFTGPRKINILSENYPQLQMLFDSDLLNGAATEQEPGDSEGCYTLTKIRNMTLEANMDGKELTCEMTISSPVIRQKVTTEVEVLYSARDISCTFNNTKTEVGSMITCSADGNPQPHFVWSDQITGNVTHGQSLIITENMVGKNKWRCIALNTVNGLMYQDNLTVEFEVVPNYKSVPAEGSGEKEMVSSEPGNDSWKFGMIAIGVTIPILVIACLTAVSSYRRRRKELLYQLISGTDEEKGFVKSQGEVQWLQIARNIELVNHINALEDEQYLTKEAAEKMEELLPESNQAFPIVRPSPFILLIRKSSDLIRSDNYVTLIETMVPIYVKSQDKLKEDPLLSFVLQLERSPSMTQYHKRLIQLLQVLMTLDSPNDTRSRCLRSLVTRTTEWNICQGEKMTPERHASKISETIKYVPLHWDKDFINILMSLLNAVAHTERSPESSIQGSNLHVVFKVMPQVIVTKPDLFSDLLKLLELMMTESSLACSNVDRNKRNILHTLVDLRQTWLLPGCAEQLQQVIEKVKAKNSALLWATDELNQTPLHTLFISILKVDEKFHIDKFLECVNDIAIVLESENSVTTQAKNSRTILHVLVRIMSPSMSKKSSESLFQVLKIIISHFDITMQDSDGNTALHLLVLNAKDWSNDPQFFVRLIKCLVSPTAINIQNNDGRTALSIFVGFADDWVNYSVIFLEVVKCLVSYTNITKEDHQGKTAVELFSKSGKTWKHCSRIFLRVFKLLVCRIENKTSNEDSSAVLDLFKYWGNDLAAHPEAFMLIVRMPGHLDVRDYKFGDGNTLLHEFVSWTKVWTDHPEAFLGVVEWLISPNNIDFKNGKKETALQIFVHWAAEWKDHPEAFVRVVKHLKSPKNIYDREETGSTALSVFLLSEYSWRNHSKMFVKVVECLISPTNDDNEADDSAKLVDKLLAWLKYWIDKPDGSFEILKCLSSLAVMQLWKNKLTKFLQIFGKNYESGILVSLSRKNWQTAFKSFVGFSNIGIEAGSGDTALHVFISHAENWTNEPETFLHVVQCLIPNTGVNIKNSNGNTLLHIFTSKAGKWKNQTKLFLQVVECLRSPFNIDMKNGDGATALHLFTSAANEWKGHPEKFFEVVRYLRSSTNIYYQNKSGNTALSNFILNENTWSLRTEFVKAVRYLISSGENEKGSNILPVQTFTSWIKYWLDQPDGSFEVFKCLSSDIIIHLEHADRINVFQELSAIFTIGEEGKAELPISLNRENWQSCYLNIFRSFISFSNISNKSPSAGTPALQTFISCGRNWANNPNVFLEIVKCLVSDKATKLQNDEGNTALHMCTADAHEWKDHPEAFLQMVKCLKSPYNIDLQNDLGDTALHTFLSLTSKWVDHPDTFLEVVKCLKSDTNIHIKSRGETALHLFTHKAGTWKKHPGTFVAVTDELRSSTNIDDRNYLDATALHLFTYKAGEWMEHPEKVLKIVEYLKSPTNIDMQSIVRHVPLHGITWLVSAWVKSSQIFLEIIKCLRSSANIAIQDLSGDTALHNLLFSLIDWGKSEQEFIGFVKREIKHLVVEIKTPKENTPGHMYTCLLKNASRHELESFCKLIQEKVSPECAIIAEKESETEIEVLNSKSGKWEDCPKMLLEVVQCLASPANINLQNKDGDTALHLFARSKSEWTNHSETTEIIKSLMSPENIDMKNNNGKTPIELIKENWGDQADPFLETEFTMRLKKGAVATLEIASTFRSETDDEYLMQLKRYDLS